MDGDVPNLCPAYEQRVDLGSGVFALFTDEPRDRASRIAVEHTCTRPRDGLTVICAPFLTGGPAGHQLLSEEPLTVSPSVLCADCGLHGFITDGVWRSV